MNTDLVIFITGCASGIGRHLAQVLYHRPERHRLVLTDINDAAIAEYAAAWPPERVLRRRLDVRDAAAWDEAVAQCVAAFGRLDVLLNVAGYLLPGYVHETPAEQIDRHLDINAKGVIHGTRAAAVHMVRRGRGHIINIGSLAALAPVPGLCLYSAAKFAVRGFSLAAAQELRPHGVAVTLVCPDAVQTPMLDLQLGYKEAALTFSGSRVLTVDELTRVIVGPVMRRRPMEVVLPRGRGLLAKLATMAPALIARLGPALTKQGLRRQEQMRAR
jgi:3-oxoacyl-[acyl-carrier protein] reductase